MSTTISMREKILMAAERRVRGGGFAEMSFRDVASDVGIKSASVHYHFPTKRDLGEALVERYAEHFAARLADVDQTEPLKALEGFIALYDAALEPGEAICLCAVVSAEAAGLPDEINQKTKAFYDANIAWLARLFDARLGDAARPLATMIVSALQGAMTMASALKSREPFHTTADMLMETARARLG